MAQGVYKQSRGFVQFIGEQILKPNDSPFVLLDNQRRAFALVKARVGQAVLGIKKPKKTVILIQGPPGSGKSVVAAKVWASLVTDSTLPSGNVVVCTTSASQGSNWRYLFEKASRESGAKGVVVKATAYTPLTTGQFGKLRKK
jgi:SpoVK/Ycf46/Vps4 family AAA+-type ATPase